MMLYAVPVLTALFIWWFTTGAIFYLDNLPVKTFKWSMLGATALLLIAFGVLSATAHQTDTQSVYLAFAAGLVVWGWQEISLYLGFVTGIRKAHCPDNCGGLRHFWHAIEANLWHEVAILTTGAFLIYLVGGAENRFGLWTYGLLWAMNLSARLNVFLGVRNVSAAFVPAHVEFLKSFLNQRPMNLLFPVSVTVATTATFFLVGKIADAASEAESVGYTLLATMAGLALVEHWMLVLPIPVEKLWNWSLPGDTRSAPSRSASSRFRADHPVEFATLKAPLTPKPDLPCC
jgi:putative photosynthetic complex assembly protein 2